NDRFASRAVAGRLFAGITDPISGQPETKHTTVRVEPFTANWQGLLVGADLPALEAPWWVRRHGVGAELMQLAGDATDQRAPVVEALCRAFGPTALEVHDARKHTARYAWMHDGRLRAVLFLAPDGLDVAAEWLAGQIGRQLDNVTDRASALAGHSASGPADAGRIICACFSVGLKTLTQDIRRGNLRSIEDIGSSLKAGTGCGSCVPELKRLLAETSRAI
ncbi:MAG TPA: (2Fe-2S)-binding protein, partial [Magnetospirillum sp.]|nr:(2Fe-2S)-binding protein [Magnetospirillum sp.]